MTIGLGEGERKINMEKKFWGYSSEEEALKTWGKLLENGMRSEKIITKCSSAKECIGMIEYDRFIYSDGSEDEGVQTKETTVILKDNIIRF